MKLKFVKDPDNRWYVELPNWEGDRSDLEMVMGADTMCDILAQGENEIWLDLTDKKEFGTEFISLVGILDPPLSGAVYRIGKLKGIEYNTEIWLCDVTKFVFGCFPEFISIK